MMVLDVSQAPRDPADVMIVNQRHYAHGFAVILCDCLFDQSGTHQAADRLAAVGISVQLAITIEEAKQFAANRHAEPHEWVFHRYPTFLRAANFEAVRLCKFISNGWTTSRR